MSTPRHTQGIFPGAARTYTRRLRLDVRHGGRVLTCSKTFAQRFRERRQVRGQESTRRSRRSPSRSMASVGVHIAKKNWDDTTPKAERTRRMAAAGARCKRMRQSTVHMPSQGDGRWRCARCLRTGARIDTALAHVCKAGPRHRRFVADRYVFCARGGSHSAKRARGLLEECSGISTNAGKWALSCLWGGFAPGTAKRRCIAHDDRVHRLSRPVPIGAEYFDEIIIILSEGPRRPAKIRGHCYRVTS